MNPQQAPRMAGWLESAWLARYLDRKLSDEETAWFEAYVLDKPDLLTSIDADTRLRDAVAASMSEHVAAIGDGALPSTPRRRSFSANRWLATAAAVAVAIGGGWLGRGALDPEANPDVIVNPLPYTGANRGAHIPQGSKSDSPYVLIEQVISHDASDVALRIGTQRFPLRPEDDVVRALVRRTAMRAPDGVMLEYRRNGVLEHESLVLEDDR